MRECITKGGRNGWREGEREEGYFKGREGVGRERGIVRGLLQREGEGVKEGGRYGKEGRGEGGREKEVITKGGRGRKGGYYKGSIDGWKNEDRDGSYYKGSGEAGCVSQMEGWRAGGSEGGRENITNERIETVISAISNIYDVMA